MFNENRSFLELSSSVEEDVKSKKLFTDAYKYYNPTELNVKCYDYTFLHRYYVFRKVEMNLNEIKQRKMHAKKTSKDRKQQQQKGKFTRDV